MRNVRTMLVVVVLTLGLVERSPAAPAPDGDPNHARAEAIAVELVSLRSERAKTFIAPETEVTAQTFLQVCAPVKKRAEELAAREGVVIRQVATKHRNPKNAATPSEARVLDAFQNDPDQRDRWDRIEFEGKRYERYMRRIDVEEACLKCHGPKHARPEFIVTTYPDDKAFGFQVGDLRGAIVVMVPSE